MKAGFTINVKGLQKKLAKAASIQAADFNAELLEFTRKSLTTATRLTPSRDYSLIRKNQLKQYSQRVNCIPDSHSLPDPSLRIRSRQHWLYFSGKWWNAGEWRLPQDAWIAYRSLLAEHERRMEYAQATFIKDRAQARFLYKKSWTEIGESLGLRIASDANVRRSVTRRKPKQNPPRGYGQIRGKKTSQTVVIRNPFLEQPSRYKDFSGQQIIKNAMAVHNAEYLRSISRRMRQLTSKI